MSNAIQTGHHGAALEEAWSSWCSGSWGIGAVLVDPTTDEIVSRGRNRFLEQPNELRTVAGNFMAHAEMNAFAALPRLNAKHIGRSDVIPQSRSTRTSQSTLLVG